MVASVRNPFASRPADAGKGNLNDYRYSLVPNNRKVTITLAECDAHQDEIAKLPVGEPIQSFISPRTAEEERTDAPIAVRFFVDSRMTGVMGMVPRGLEPAVIEALVRLDGTSRAQRIPARVDKTRSGLRVVLLMGETR